MLNEDYRDILFAFAEEKVRYLVVGAYALAVHGHPRATGDIDLWIEPTASNASSVVRALEAFLSSPININKENFLEPDLLLQIGIEPNRVDILTSITGLDRFDVAWADRKEVQIDDVMVNVLSRADLIASKKASARLQDLADVERLENSSHE